MGYEVKYYIVEKSTLSGDDFAEGKIYAKTIAMFDLCKDYSISEFTSEYPATNYYIFADDGNTPIITDSYDTELKEIPLKDMIDFVEKTIKEKDYYRRRLPLLNLLRSFDNDDWANIVVLQYGY